MLCRCLRCIYSLRRPTPPTPPRRLVRTLSDVEREFVAVERVEEYAALPPEAQTLPGVAPLAPPAAWPSAGAIELRDVHLRYRAATPEVLRGVTLRIPPGARVGVCGRTGAGKSSLIAALLRTADVVAGGCVIDGLDATRVPLRSLRSRIALVPQDSGMVAGSLRRNLDVLGVCSDAQLWDALRAVGMDSAFASLDVHVTEGGANLSGGERQLLGVARAFLRHAKIVIFDEATANCDAASDARVQAAVKRAFVGSTVITIAHRLHTILDSDIVVVLEAGAVLEAGPPASLLADAGSAFASLVRKSTRGGGGGGANV